MDIELKTAGLEGGKRLDIRKSNSTWSLWEGEIELERGLTISDKSLGLDHYKVIVNNDGASVRVIRFADLHRHSENSLLDGITKVSDLVKHTEYAGALTDHGNLYGFLEFYKGMLAAGKHPIIGFEAYQEDLLGKLAHYHLILLAKNTQGYRNLLHLTSESYHHFDRKPHVTWEMLERCHGGIICTSACLGGYIPQLLKQGNWDEAVEVAKRLLGIFGEDFYLEVQRHRLADESIVNPKLITLSQTLGISLIATTDSHYLHMEDSAAHEVALCMQTKKTLDEPHYAFEGTGYHLHSSEEMEQLFADMPEALDNTLLLAEKCNVEVQLGEVNLPNYAIPEGFQSPLDYFRHLCETGFQKRFKGKPELTDQRYIDRFEYEYKVISQMHFESYFIIVQDFINYAKSHGIYVGPGRGSAAGSLLAFCMGITDMDPIRFNLLFERFLNPDRISWPDIDTDIAHTGRQNVIDYITKKYGSESVCRIVTFGTLAPKMVIKDVSRVLGYPPAWANALSNLVPNDPKMTLDKAMEMNPELQRRYASDAEVQEVINIAKTLEGGKRHASQHACGVVIAPGPISNFLPTSMETDEETGEKGLTSQVIMSEVEELSLLKMDLLGLKNLTAIHEVITSIKKTRGIYTTYQSLPLDDRETYQMLSKGITGGVFQLESAGMTNLVEQMFSDIDSLPDGQMHECFERLIAAVALYRPGPMDYIPDYLAGMRDRSSIHYDCAGEEKLLESTYGVMVYQEQLMQLSQELAGFSAGEADVLRKACGKKKQELLDKEHDKFVYGNRKEFEKGTDAFFIPGCVGNGIGKEVAEGIWEKVEKFGSYAFNRSHSACYAWLAFITAYMSCHWTPEFYCGMINAFEEMGDKVKAYLSQASKRGVQILPPDVNKSKDKCVVEGTAIRLGFHALSHLNKFGSYILRERKAQGDFSDFQDFYDRMADAGQKPGKNIMESLIFSGALGSFGMNHRQLELMSSLLETNYKKTAADRIMGQVSLFGGNAGKLPIPEAEDYQPSVLMNKEFTAVGFYLTNHPVDSLYSAAAGRDRFVPISDFTDRDTPLADFFTYGIIRDLKQIFTKKREEMFLFSVDDRYNSLRCVLFPSYVSASKHLLQEGAVVRVIGEFTVDEEHGPQIIVKRLSSPVEEPSDYASVHVTIRNKEEQEALLNYAKERPGNVQISLVANGKTYKTRVKIALTPEALDWMTSHFANVTT